RRTVRIHAGPTDIAWPVHLAEVGHDLVRDDNTEGRTHILCLDDDMFGTKGFIGGQITVKIVLRLPLAVLVDASVIGQVLCTGSELWNRRATIEINNFHAAIIG